MDLLEFKRQQELKQQSQSVEETKSTETQESTRGGLNEDQTDFGTDFESNDEEREFIPIKKQTGEVEFEFEPHEFESEPESDPKSNLKKKKQLKRPKSDKPLKQKITHTFPTNVALIATSSLFLIGSVGMILTPSKPTITHKIVTVDKKVVHTKINTVTKNETKVVPFTGKYQLIQYLAKSNVKHPKPLQKQQAKINSTGTAVTPTKPVTITKKQQTSVLKPVKPVKPIVSVVSSSGQMNTVVTFYRGKSHYFIGIGNVPSKEATNWLTWVSKNQPKKLPKKTFGCTDYAQFGQKMKPFNAETCSGAIRLGDDWIVGQEKASEPKLKPKKPTKSTKAANTSNKSASQSSPTKSQKPVNQATKLNTFSQKIVSKVYPVFSSTLTKFYEKYPANSDTQAYEYTTSIKYGISQTAPTVDVQVIFYGNFQNQTFPYEQISAGGQLFSNLPSFESWLSKKYGELTSYNDVGYFNAEIDNNFAQNAPYNVSSINVNSTKLPY